MIFGIGADLVDVRRIEKAYARFGDLFLRRILSPEEQKQLTISQSALPLLLAKRFAAKEACAKAIGTGISKTVSWHDIRVIHETRSRPQLQISQRVLTFLQTQIKGASHIQLDLSLSDEYPYIQAFVIVSYFYQENR